MASIAPRMATISACGYLTALKKSRGDLDPVSRAFLTPAFAATAKFLKIKLWLK
jgi:hypothetical protein